MKDWKALGLKLLYPPVWLIILLSIASTAALLYVFLNGLDTAPIAYVTYVLSFYALTVVCAVLARVLPGVLKKAKHKVYANPFGNRYMTDIAYKTYISLQRSLIINLSYVVFNTISIFLYRSWWFAIFTIYYSILALMRYLLRRFSDQVGIDADRMAELKCSRLCSYILMTVNLVLSGAVLMILYEDKGSDYGSILIYVVALYTFYMTTHSIISIVKYRKYNSPVMSTSKNISLASALVSMLSLETAMFSQFGADMPEVNQKIMIMATGGGVSLIVVALSIYTIIKTSREIKKLCSMPSGGD